MEMEQSEADAASWLGETAQRLARVELALGRAAAGLEYDLKIVDAEDPEQVQLLRGIADRLIGIANQASAATGKLAETIGENELTLSADYNHREGTGLLAPVEEEPAEFRSPIGKALRRVHGQTLPLPQPPTRLEKLRAEKPDLGSAIVPLEEIPQPEVAEADQIKVYVVNGQDLELNDQRIELSQDHRHIFNVMALTREEPGGMTRRDAEALGFGADLPYQASKQVRFSVKMGELRRGLQRAMPDEERYRTQIVKEWKVSGDRMHHYGLNPAVVFEAKTVDEEQEQWPPLSEITETIVAATAAREQEYQDRLTRAGDLYDEWVDLELLPEAEEEATADLIITGPDSIELGGKEEKVSLNDRYALSLIMLRRDRKTSLAAAKAAGFHPRASSVAAINQAWSHSMRRLQKLRVGEEPVIIREGHATGTRYTFNPRLRVINESQERSAAREEQLLKLTAEREARVAERKNAFEAAQRAREEVREARQRAAEERRAAREQRQQQRQEAMKIEAALRAARQSTRQPSFRPRRPRTEPEVRPFVTFSSPARQPVAIPKVEANTALGIVQTEGKENYFDRVRKALLGKGNLPQPRSESERHFFQKAFRAVIDDHDEMTKASVKSNISQAQAILMGTHRKDLEEPSYADAVSVEDLRKQQGSKQ